MGRHRKPIEQLKLEGTYDASRHSKSAEPIINLILPLSKIDIPPTLTDEYVKSFFEHHTDMLIRLGILQNSDMPEIEFMCITLQIIRKIDLELLELSKKGTISENIELFALLTGSRLKHGKTFSTIASKYYVSPTARAKLQLDFLNIEKLKTENPSIMQKLLGNKKN